MGHNHRIKVTNRVPPFSGVVAPRHRFWYPEPYWPPRFAPYTRTVSCPQYENTNTCKMMEAFEKQYAGSFDWRRKRHISNLAELGNLPGAGDDPLFPSFIACFEQPLRKDAIEDALRRSILYLSLEAIHTYVLGYFQACVLTCGAVFERVLKLEYRRKHGTLPKGHWTLGKCAYQLDWTETPITSNHLDQIKAFLGPRNSRAHALLEHEEPHIAAMGGRDRGIEVLSSGHYLIEPFRGEAKKGVETLYNVLSSLYASK